jgi:hypothetical protein
MIGFYLFAFDIKTNIPYILFNHFSFYSFLSSQQNKPFRMFLLSSAFLPPSQFLLLKWFAPHDIADNLVGRKWQFLNAYVFEFWSCIKYAIVSFLFIFPHVELFILYTHAHTHTHTHTHTPQSILFLYTFAGSMWARTAWIPIHVALYFFMLTNEWCIWSMITFMNTNAFYLDFSLKDFKLSHKAVYELLSSRDPPPLLF